MKVEDRGSATDLPRAFQLVAIKEVKRRLDKTNHKRVVIDHATVVR